MSPRKHPPQPPEEPEEPQQGEGEHVWGDWRLPPPLDIADLDTAVLSTEVVIRELEAARQREVGYHQVQSRAYREAAAVLDADIARAKQLEAALAERYRLVLADPPRSTTEMAVAARWLEELGAARLATATLEEEQRTLRGQASAHEAAAAQIKRGTYPPRGSG
jgi:hypothetical protein